MSTSDTAILFKTLQKLEGASYLRAYLTYHSASLRAQLRPAVLVACSAKGKDIQQIWSMYSAEILSELALDALHLGMRDGKLYLLLYHEQMLEDTLSSKEVLHLLQEHFSYPAECNFHALLNHLRLRFSMFVCPDEIGLFLGYPIEDVRSYIECDGKDYLYCGYWKVYHNVDHCKKLFARLDLARQQTASAILAEVERLQVAM